MNKKASMELGVNAIIILIIALAILGLAMSFVTGLFKGGQKKLGGLIERTDLPVHADSTNPMVFDSSEIAIKLSNPERSTTLIISVYNTNFGEGEEVSLDIPYCVNSANEEVGYFAISAPMQSITPGSDAGYKAIVTAGDDIGTGETGTYICTIRATGGDVEISQQIFITVTN